MTAEKRQMADFARYQNQPFDFSAVKWPFIGSSQNIAPPKPLLALSRAVRRHFRPFSLPKVANWSRPTTFQALFAAPESLKVNERDSDKSPELKNNW